MRAEERELVERWDSLVGAEAWEERFLEAEFGFDFQESFHDVSLYVGGWNGKEGFIEIMVMEHVVCDL